MIDDKSLILPDSLRVSVSICSRRRRERSIRYRTSQNPRSAEPARSAQPAPMKCTGGDLNNALAPNQIVDIEGVALKRRDLRPPQGDGCRGFGTGTRGPSAAPWSSKRPADAHNETDGQSAFAARPV
jgi:hypothetical protein